uniref:C-X-C motif chemokine 8 n=1 Tax=Chelonoidis abingdonii TaxID=106734 RepID=A0A8C0H4T8_CHEAB
PLTMNGKLVVAALALFLTYAAVLARMGNELRCQCINLHSKFIPPRNIRDVKLTPIVLQNFSKGWEALAGPHHPGRLPKSDF